MQTVLFVDDSKSMRRAYRMQLEKAGFKVVLASDGEEALAIVNDQAIDVVVLDVHMQRLGGVPTMTRLRAMRPALPIVLHSSYRESDVLRRTQQKPDAYVNKSASSQELKETIAALLMKHKSDDFVGLPSANRRADPAEASKICSNNRAPQTNNAQAHSIPRCHD